MFERTFSFWRRWVGQEGAPSGAQPCPSENNGHDERRLWVRYPADLKTSVELANPAQPFKSEAKIRDISRGGANLILDREVQPGLLVNLELPNASEGVYSVLACVVRIHQEASDKWALGCVFARELSEEDLNRFGARRVRHAPEDQRIWMRFSTALKASFEQIGASGQPRRDAEVLNLSASGVGLLVDRFIDAGALLNVDLVGKEGTAARTILSCVVHVNQRDDGAWALGCNFIRELSEEDLRALV
jgi:hypothetical protein